MKVRVVVVEDEDLARERVVDLMRSHADLELAGIARDGAEALDVIGRQQPDLVLLDIQLPELNGFEVVAALDADELPAIIFVTAYDEYAIRAFEVEAVDYLLKPITPSRFDAAIERARKRIATSEPGRSDTLRSAASRADAARGPAERFVARRGNKHYFVKTVDVESIEAVGNYVQLRAGSATHLIRSTMKSIEQRLDPVQFVRLHRSHIVRIDAIQSIEPRDEGEYFVTLRSGARITTSRTYNEQVRSLLR